MRVLIISSAPEAIADFLVSAGHEVKECLSTDLAPRMTGEFAPEAVIFSEDVAEILPVGHRGALREIVPLARVVLLAGRKNPIVQYAAALGVRDFVFLPAGPAEILHRLENPAKPEEAAEMLDKFDLQTKEEKQIAVQKEDKESHKTGLLGRMFGKKNQENDREGILKEETPDIEKTILYKSVTPQNSKLGISRLLGKLITHGKPGIIVNGDYIEGSWKTPAEVLDEKCDAVTPAIRSYDYGHDEPCEFSRNDKTDALTGLFTRKALQETELPEKYGVLFCDLDKFKTVNDTYGHNIGDRILEEFGATLMQILRETDIAARWGGDEFVLVIPGADRKAAERVAERIQFRWEANLLAQKYNVGVSIGVGESRQGTTFEKVVAGADANMYQRKKKRTGVKPRLYFTCCSGEDPVWFRKLGGCILIDADPEMELSRSIANSEGLWKSDWRLGLNAEPLLLPYKIRFYGLSPELGPLDARDYEAFNDFVMVALTKGRVVINVGSDEEIEAKLSGLGAVPLEGVYSA